MPMFQAVTTIFERLAPVVLSSQFSWTAVPTTTTDIPLPKESAQFSAILPHAFISQKVVSTLSQVPSGFLLDLDVTTVKIAKALPLGVNFNSGSLTIFPMIVIGALMLCAFH